MTDIGEAVVVRNADGTRRVERADPVIRVSTELLTSPDNDPDVIETDGTLRLDTAGQHRYRFVRVEDEHTHIYERVTPLPPGMVHRSTFPTFGDGTVRPQAGG